MAPEVCIVTKEIHVAGFYTSVHYLLINQLSICFKLTAKYVFSQSTSSGDMLPSMSELSPMEEFFCHASVGETVSLIYSTTTMSTT